MRRATCHLPWMLLASAFAAGGCGRADARARDAGSHCPEVVDFQQTGTLGDPALAEISGMVASRSQPGVYFVHNDSGDSARFFAIDETGSALAEFTLPGASHVDWEDVALGPTADGEGDALYLGDIGDNGAMRPSVTVYRVDEPRVDADAGRGPFALAGAEALVFAYPDGPHNAETLLVDPRDGSLYVLAKTDPGPSPLFRAQPPFAPGATTTFEAMGHVVFAEGNPLATGGDVSSDGAYVVVRTYTHLRIYARREGVSLAASLALPPCALVEDFAFIAEAVAFDPEGAALRTVSEGGGSPLYRFSLR